MKKKLILGLLASTLTLACVAGCTDNGGNSSSGDATNGLDDAKAYLTLLYNKPDLVEGRADYDVVNTVSIEGVTYTVTWTVDVESGVVIEAGEDKTVVNVDETSDTEVAYVLTATITDADGNTTTVTFNRTLLAAPSIVPSPITAAPEEETAYKLYMYQVTNKGDAYFTGKMSGFYYQSSSTLADAVDVYAKAVDGGYNLYFTDADGVTQYLGIENEYSDSQGKFYNNVIFSESTEIAEGKIATYTFTWSDEYGTMITKLNAKSGTDKETTETAEVTLYLGTYDTFWTFSASDIKKITNDDTCIAYLVEMVDKSAISAEDKVAAEKAAIDVQTIHNGDATVELPVKGATYGDVTISWAIKSGENVALDGNTLTITAPSASTTAVITATLTCGEVSDTLDVELTLNPTPAAAVIPEAGVAYKMYLNQVTNGTVLYLDGGVSGRYLTMTEKGSEAIDVYAEVVEGGYKFYTNVDSAKKYINIYNNDAGKASVNYADATENVYNYDEEKNCWYTALGSDEVYLGTYNNFATVSASYTSYIDADNTGISQFPALFIKATDVPADNVPDEGETPVVSNPDLDETAAYKFYLTQVNLNKVLFLDGGINGRYLTMTEDTAGAVDVYAEKSENSYKFYILVDSVKNYITIYSNDKSETSIKYAADAATVFDYNADLNCWYTTFNDQEVYMGTYGTFNTVSVSATSYISTTNTGVSQFPVEMVLANEVDSVLPEEDGEEEVATLPVADQAYYLRATNSETYAIGVSDNGEYLTVGDAAGDLTITFEAVADVENGYNIKLSNGNYVNSASSGNKLAFAETATAVWVIDLETKQIKLNGTEYVLQYNASSPRISRYKGTQLAIWFEIVE